MSTSFRPKTAALSVAAVALLVPALAFAGDDFSATLDKGLLWTYLTAFGVGFLTSLTPCVYPMIPIVLGVFGARGEAVSRRRSFALALAYVLGMGLLFSALGVIFALVGKQSGSLLSKPSVVLPMVAIYLVLATSMFGAFELNLPMSWQQKLNSVGGAGYGGAFAMGCVGGLTAAPCVGPFLGAMLIWVAQTQNVFLGGSLLFVYALGMGVLFFALAIFTLSLPKSGGWMEGVKSVGGIGLLVAAFYYLLPIFPVLTKLASTSLLPKLVAFAAVIAGVALGAVHLSFHERQYRLRKGLGVIMAAAGLMFLVNSYFAPERKLAWVTDESAAFAQAKQEDKGVMIDFAATWCNPCKKFEKTFADPEVYTTIVDNFVPLKFDVSNGTDSDEAIRKKYGATTLPAVIFVDAGGKELGRARELMDAPQFLKTLQQVTGGSETASR